MNINDLPQPNISGDAEIFRLLKIGPYSIVPAKHGFEIIETTAVEKAHEPAKLAASKSAVASKISKYIKPFAGWILYPAVFGISFSIFYFSLNFPSLTAQIGSWFNTKSQAQTQLGDNLAAYNAWIRGYFYTVSNKDLLAPNNDYDKDGLTNLDEFYMKTNPTVADSDSDGTSDGVEVLDSTNPWGAGAMTGQQKELRDQLDLALISDRIGFASASARLTSTTNVQDKFDLNRPGQLSIPKLNMQVPLIWSKDPSEFDNDLEHGVIHYPGTALPGEQGVMYVSGHSSDYIWKHNPFSTVFTKINRLSPGDDVFVTVYGVDGKTYVYRYRVMSNKIYSPDDQTQFIDNSSAKLNLSTCWPIGTSKDRLVVTAELVGL